MEDWDEAPDCVEDSMGRHQCPLTRPHHTHQRMHLSRQTTTAREGEREGGREEEDIDYRDFPTQTMPGYEVLTIIIQLGKLL